MNATSPSGQDCRFSVVIVHRDGAEMLLRVLGALNRAIDAQSDEIFVVDNNSGDDSLARIEAKYPGVKVIANPCNNGFSRANNQAISQARGRYLLLLNNDAFIEPGLLDRLEHLFDTEPRAAIISPRLFGEDGKPHRCHGLIPGAFEQLKPKFLRRRQKPLPDSGLAPVETIIGACMGVRAAAVAEAGSLDDTFFFYYEETEWCHRMRAHGWKVIVDCDSRIVHLKGGSTRGVPRRKPQLEIFRSRLLFLQRVYSPMAASLLSAYHLIRLLLNFTLSSLVVALTLGLMPGPNRRFIAQGYQLLWLLLGMPDGWGLSDKCPWPPMSDNKP